MRGEKRKRRADACYTQGSPPHARGKACPGPGVQPPERITPACAGKSDDGLQIVLGLGDHPRMRGEKLHIHINGGKHFGITPACAGKRSPRCAPACPCWDHPRMRGEKFRLHAAAPLLSGSPPHARGKADINPLGHTHHRITPACAGKRSPRK